MGRKNGELIFPEFVMFSMLILPGLYRGPPSQRPGPRYYRYSDSLESPAREGYSRDFGTPTRARDHSRNVISNTPPSALQQWNMMIRDA